MTAAIEVTQLEKTYDIGKPSAKQALKAIDLSIPRGSFFGLLGPNGAGKSTLINILAGLVIKTGGTASICGHDIDTDMRAARTSIGVVPQELVLDTFFTVRQALENHAGYYGVPKAKRRTAEIIEALSLNDKADIHARKLSGGMRRRLLVAKALVHNPPVLVLDEPTAGVDVELRTQLWEYVRKLNKQGTTVLLTTHYLEEAEELCDEIAIINHGRVIKRDTKANLMRSVDSKQLVVRPHTLLKKLPEALMAKGAALDAQGHIVISYQPSTQAIQPLLDLLRECDIAICDISTQEPDLEEVFRSLTSSVKAA